MSMYQDILESVGISDSEVDDCLNWCADAEDAGTNYFGMTYEQGVRDAIEWLAGHRTEGPHE